MTKFNESARKPRAAAGGDAPTLQDVGPPAGETPEVRLREAKTERSAMPAPIAAVRGDVSRLTAFFGSIHGRVLWAGVLLCVLTAGVGIAVATAGGLVDWYMHAGMYLVIFAFTMFYIRAHLAKRRWNRGFYGVATLLLIAFFGWVLVDLIPPRLVVFAVETVGADGSIEAMPKSVERPRMLALIAPIILLGLTGLWLFLHWVIVAPYSARHDAHQASTQQGEG